MKQNPANYIHLYYNGWYELYRIKFALWDREL